MCEKQMFRPAERIYTVDRKGSCRVGVKYAGKQYILRECKDGAITLLPVTVTVTVQEAQEPSNDIKAQGSTEEP